MNYSASILISTDSETYERFTDEKNMYRYFKELFGKKRSRIIEESFSAPDILTKLNAAFKSSGINNLVRITHDDTDFFLDTENEPNDLGGMINKLKNKLKNSFERFYEEIAVVMETRQSHIDFVIELLLLRVHHVGEYPIQINFFGIPKTADVVDVENKFKLLVSKVEQNIHKFMSINDVTVSFTKKTEYNIIKTDNKETNLTEKFLTEHPKEEFYPEYVSLKEKCDFFPLYGITLGKTSIKELAKIGTKAKDKDSDNKPFKYYRVNDMNFWHDNKVASHMYLTQTSSIPLSWRNCGLDWYLSYNEWLTLFEKLGFFISHVEKPKKELYNGKRTLVAEFNATRKISDNAQLEFEIYFNYSYRTSVNSKGTIYSLAVRVY